PLGRPAFPEFVPRKRRRYRSQSRCRRAYAARHRVLFRRPNGARNPPPLRPVAAVIRHLAGAGRRGTNSPLPRAVRGGEATGWRESAGTWAYGANVVAGVGQGALHRKRSAQKKRQSEARKLALPYL